MVLRNVELQYVCGITSKLPDTGQPEVAFAGKSNVGKSSLLNKLVNRKSLARVSATPGKTATINFFRLSDCRLVDLPGYGYAKVSQAEKKRWAELVEGYFAQERNIRLVIQLLDLRHAPTEDDRGMVEFLLESEIPFVAVCTKADKLNKTQRTAQIAYYQELFSETDIQVLPFSSQTGEGVSELQALIESACLPPEEALQP